MKRIHYVLTGALFAALAAACTLVKEAEPDTDWSQPRQSTSNTPAATATATTMISATMPLAAPILVPSVATTTALPAGRGVGRGTAPALRLGPVPADPPPSTVADPLPKTPDGYVLVWHDEFNKDGPLNPDDWAYENGFVRNQEAQWYQPDNAICKDGYLVIEARKETKPNPRYTPPLGVNASAPATAPAIAPATTTAPATGRGRGARGGRGGTGWPNLPTITVTAASVNTRGKHSWTYGRFEIRARIDTRSGSWPAFWSLGTAGGWPANGEVDIMEYYRNMVLANIAWAGGGGATWNSKRMQLDTLPANFSDTFHTWRMDWDATSIKLFLDDVMVNEQDLTRTVNAGRGGAAGINPFIDRPVYLLLNLAIGGQNGGDYSRTDFPIKFYVDYVRVYQKPSAP